MNLQIPFLVPILSPLIKLELMCFYYSNYRETDEKVGEELMNRGKNDEPICQSV